MRKKEQQELKNEMVDEIDSFQLRYLWVEDFFKLKKFDIRISSNLVVLIGENGSGKSTVIECLADIFGHLYKYFVLDDLTAEFINNYKIEYVIGGRDINIESHYSDSNTNTFAPYITIDDEPVDMAKKSQRKNFIRYLPSKIVLSYSGISKHIYQLNKHFEDKYIDKIINTQKNYSLKPLNLPETNPFVYIKAEYVEFITLALMAQKSETANKILNKIGVNVNNCSITITIKKPYWAKKNSKDSAYPWGIQGKVSTDFIDGLNSFGTLNEKGNKDQYQYVFYGVNDIQEFFNLFELSSGQVLGFFDTLLCDDILDSVRISWKQDDVELALDRLSEGEKQLLLSEGLCSTLNSKNILLLMDEPDVSLHPKWQREFIPNIREVWQKDAMAVITTHSPNIVSSLKANELKLIRDGQIVTKNPNYIGKTAEDILIDYFDLSSTRSVEAENLINKVWCEIKNGSIDTEEFNQLLENLSRLIGRGDKELCSINLGINRIKKANAQNK